MVAGGRARDLGRWGLTVPRPKQMSSTCPKRLPAQLQSLAPSGRDFGLDKRYTKWEHRAVTWSLPHSGKGLRERKGLDTLRGNVSDRGWML